MVLTTDDWLVIKMFFFQHNEAVHSLYKQLTDKIGSEQEPPPIPENLDYLESPLMSVPTPAPHS